MLPPPSGFNSIHIITYITYIPYISRYILYKGYTLYNPISYYIPCMLPLKVKSILPFKVKATVTHSLTTMEAPALYMTRLAVFPY